MQVSVFGDGNRSIAKSLCCVGVSILANRGAIARAFEDALFDADPADEAVLDRARQDILAPRSRLEAELAFFMQIGQEDFAAFLKDMRQTGRSELASAFVGLDRANYMAHHCRPGMGRKGVGNARALVREHDRIEAARVMDVLQSARRQSGFGPVGQDEFDIAFAKWRRSHAERTLSVLDSDGDLPALLSQLVDAHGREGLLCGLMPALLLEYENRHAALLETMAQNVRTRLAELRQAGVSIAAFAQALQAWDGYAQPLQLADQARGIDESHSKELFEAIRDHCLALNNQHDLPELALQITRVARAVFAELPQAAADLARDEAILADRAADAAATRNIAPLAAAIAQARADIMDFIRQMPAPQPDGPAGPRARTVMTAFSDVHAQHDAKSIALAVDMVRSLAIDLHNEHAATSTALSLMRFMMREARVWPEHLRTRITDDGRVLTRQHGMKELRRAIAGQDWETAHSLALGLLTDADAADRAELTQLVGMIRGKQRAKWKARLGWGVAAAFILIVIAAGEGSKTSSTVDYPAADATPDNVEMPADTGDTPANLPAAQPIAPSFVPPPVPDLQASADDGGVSAPLPYSALMLSRSELRYCMRQKERLASVQSEIASQEETDRFNAAVEDYNPRCGSFRYDAADMAAVSTQVSQDKARLRREGLAILQGATM